MSVYSNALIMTPLGKRKACNLKEGDFVFSSFGLPEKIVGVSERKEDAYVIEFYDGKKIAVGESTKFLTYNKREKRQEEVSVLNLKRTTHMIKPIGPLELPALPLPLDPYALGFFMNAGERETNSMIRVKKNTASSDFSDEVLDRVAGGIGCTLINVRPPHKNYTEGGRYSFVDSNGLSIKWSYFKRHFPEELSPNLNEMKIPLPFLRASVEQRQDFLAGFLDASYRFNAKPTSQKGLLIRRRYNDELISQLRELCSSLGILYYFKKSKNEIHVYLNVEQAHKITWRTPLRSPEFLLPENNSSLYGHSIKSIRKLDKPLDMVYIKTKSETLCAESYIPIIEK